MRNHTGNGEITILTTKGRGMDYGSCWGLSLWEIRKGFSEGLDIWL